jgi:hypothetical protein
MTTKTKPAKPAGDTVSITWPQYRGCVSLALQSICGLGLDDLADTDLVTNHGWSTSYDTVTFSRADLARFARADAEEILANDDTWFLFQD